MNDLEGMFHNTDSHQLFAVVTAVHHKGTRQPLHYRALCLSKSLDLQFT